MDRVHYATYAAQNKDGHVKRRVNDRKLDSRKNNMVDERKKIYTINVVSGV